MVIGYPLIVIGWTLLHWAAICNFGVLDYWSDGVLEKPEIHFTTLQYAITPLLLHRKEQELQPALNSIWVVLFYCSNISSTQSKPNSISLPRAGRPVSGSQLIIS